MPLLSSQKLPWPMWNLSVSHDPCDIVFDARSSAIASPQDVLKWC